jgi:TolB-like protein
MLYRFHAFELDTGTFALRTSSGGDVHLEPLVFDLLAFLVEHAGEVVGRDRVIERVWRGRAVSEATIDSCVKSLRRALGDTGREQALIRTVRGRGFLFAAPVAASREAAAPARAIAETLAPPAEPDASRPPRIAVLPLHPLSADPQVGLIGDAIAQEVILELSRLHSMFVIARGSSFQFRGQEVDLARAAATLGATYFVTGTILAEADRYAVAIELCHAPDNNVVWAERFVVPADDLMQMRTLLAGKIVGALEPRIQLAEALRAARLPTERLDAWAAYHSGLWHMFRFNKRDNDRATHLFDHAVRLDPRFARAHAGLSFTHFQNAFLGFGPDRPAEIALTRRRAQEALELDPLDPFVNLTVGRAAWLASDPETALPWMERSVSLSPNYAFAIYNSALVGAILGESEASDGRVVKAIELSPIDPLNYAMLATRGLAHWMGGDGEAAVAWAETAARSPNAHVQIFAIAAILNELHGNRTRAEEHVAAIRRVNPAFSGAHFLQMFPFAPAPRRTQAERALGRIGL